MVTIDPPDPLANWVPDFAPGRASPAKRMELEVHLYGLRQAGLFDTCVEHPDTCKKVNLDGVVAKGDLEYKRCKCVNVSLDEVTEICRSHKINLSSMWQTIPSNLVIPEHLWPAWLHLITTTPPAAGLPLTARPVTRTIWERHAESRARYLVQRPKEIAALKAVRDAKVATAVAAGVQKLIFDGDSSAQTRNDFEVAVSRARAAQLEAERLQAVADGRGTPEEVIEEPEDAVFLASTPRGKEVYMAAIESVRRIKYARTSSVEDGTGHSVLGTSHAMNPEEIRKEYEPDPFFPDDLARNGRSPSPPQVVAAMTPQQLETLEWKTPSRPAQRHTTEPPAEVRTSNPFATLTVDAGYVENMAEAIEKRLSESPLIQSLLQAAREATRTNRPVVRSTEQVPKAIPAPQPNTFAGVTNTPPAKGTAGVSKPVGVRKVMTQAECDLIYKGIDPSKKRLHEVYITGIKRTKKSLLRMALRVDGIETNHIVDIGFVGKSITCFLIPVEFVAIFVESIKKTNKFTILENFDPLDITFMKNLPQYNGKSEIELLILARKLAIERLKRHMERLQASRVGTKKYYEIQVRKMEKESETGQGGSNRPQERLISDFIPQLNHTPVSNYSNDSILNESAPASMADLLTEEEPMEESDVAPMVQ